VSRAPKAKHRRARPARRYVTSVSPFRISDTAWYYAERRGVTIVAELHRDGVGHVGTVQTFIPWKQLEQHVAGRKP
jgi:hypothetical protein